MKTIASGPASGPMAQNKIDPYAIVKQNLHDLQGYYKNREDELRSYKLDPEAHNEAIAGLQEEYDQAKFKITSLKSQLDDIKRGVGAGQIDSILGQEAMIRLVVPQETADAMFPKQQKEQRGRFTPGEFKAYTEDFKNMAESAIAKPWLSRNYAEPDKLKEQYFAARAKYGYDTDMNVTERKAFDLAWDNAIGSDKKLTKAWKKLKDEDPDLFTSRTYDDRLLNIAARKINGQSVSPLAASIQGQTPKRKLTKQEATAILNQAGGDKDKARQLAKQLGYSL